MSEHISLSFSELLLSLTCSHLHPYLLQLNINKPIVWAPRQLPCLNCRLLEGKLSVDFTYN